MKISMERAWDRAITLLKGNTDVLAILAGLFFFLPGFAGVFFLGQQPQIAQGMTPEQMMPLLQAYLISIMPYILVVTVIGAIGRLAMLVLFTDRSRPTVQEALKRGLIGVLPYILATAIVAVAMSLVAALLVIAPAKAGAMAIAGIGIGLTIVLAIYVSIKVSLIPAVIVAEHTLNPLTAIRRSWRLTSGNSLRLLLFYALLLIPYVIIAALAEGLFGMVGALVGGPQGQLFVGGAASSLVGALWGALTAAITAALYEQLSGSPRTAATTFE
ncbi:MAG TPA: hypothetical protein VF418_04335 [Sphingomonadaceae bacterium]